MKQSRPADDCRGRPVGPHTGYEIAFENMGRSARLGRWRAGGKFELPAAVRIGGQIRQPRKLYHVPPIYPEGSPAGTVRLEAVIGPDGRVKETRVINDAPDALARAAIDAVQQWEFDPTLLNCEAVDVRMSVTVDFQ